MIQTGTMRLGKDAVVFTQTKDTCNIAFLSRSYNNGREVRHISLYILGQEPVMDEFDILKIIEISYAGS
jgi:hypothetical protein